MGLSSQGALENFDIAVVGGGMVGLSLAQLLSVALPFAKIVIVDSHSLKPKQEGFSARFDARTTAVSSQSADIFRYMNVWDRLVGHSTAITHVHVSDRGHMGKASYSQEDNCGEPLGYVLDNAWIGQCLLDKVLDNQSITRVGETKVCDTLVNTRGACLHLEQDEERFAIQCSLLVIADGAQSGLRHKLGISSDVYDYRQSAVIANVEYEHIHGGVAFERFTNKGPLALLPLGGSSAGHRSAIVWTTPEDSVASVMGWDDQMFMRRLQERFGFRLGKFLNVSKRHNYPLKRIIAKEQVRSSLVLMGNAAHFLHPVAGQGFNLALRDSAMLCDVLKSAYIAGSSIGSYETLSKYAESQRGDHLATSSLSHQFNRFFTDDRLLQQVSRNIGLLGLNLSLPLKKSFFSQMMGRGDLARHISC